MSMRSFVLWHACRVSCVRQGWHYLAFLAEGCMWQAMDAERGGRG
jgi:hypothetical protein